MSSFDKSLKRSPWRRSFTSSTNLAPLPLVVPSRTPSCLFKATSPMVIFLLLPSSPEDTAYVELERSVLEHGAEFYSSSWFMFLAQANLHEGAKSFIGTDLLPESYASLGCS
ncbi:putative Glucose-methanol-choline oxidoreductase N-terminal domain-containing protein [Seiridium cardinale]|uniref:Glucose-methanol-choline oxidoreductase N-terminal domain-containing protein n=1 Tax=Seiridium cardinale TaxID=138064 RepID=A0ABR2XU33_9PEZI